MLIAYLLFAALFGGYGLLSAFKPDWVVRRRMGRLKLKASSEDLRILVSVARMDGVIGALIGFGGAALALSILLMEAGVLPRAS